MKKVFILAYARANLGDDIFIKMLLEKYPEIDFYIKVKQYNFIEKMDKYKNLNILIGNDTDEELWKSQVDEYDGYVYIGGSIFMEGGKVYNLSPKFYDFVKRCKEKNIPFCYISCNYGPYETKEYFELSRQNFKTCTDICFRDKYSYNLFKDIENVRYAPDYAFSYDIKKQDKIPNSVGISVVNLSVRKDLKHKSEDYDRLLENNIKKYLDEGKKVYLYSFCEHEEDEEVIDKLTAKFKDIISVKYDGDISKFLDIYSKMEYMICARFHAMILSCICNQKMLITSYSKKIDNVIEDLKLELPIVHFKDISSNMNIDLKDFKLAENIEEIIEKSKRQDEIFSKILGEKSQN